MTTTPLARGMYLVEHDDQRAIVYVAGTASDRWMFWNGRVFRGDAGADAGTAALRARPAVAPSLTAPMPARVVKVLTAPGAVVAKGETLILLEAMKMELPVRAPEAAVVGVIHCREGDLVQADAVLIDLSPP